jgi:hypothetical protein
LGWLGEGHTGLHRLLGRKHKLLLHFTVDYWDMLLPEAEQLIIILGENTVKVVVPINQILGHFCKANRFAIWVLHWIFQPIWIDCEIWDIIGFVCRILSPTLLWLRPSRRAMTLSARRLRFALIDFF